MASRALQGRSRLEHLNFAVSESANIARHLPLMADRQPDHPAIKVPRGRVMQKMQAKTVTELIHFAQKAGIASLQH